MAWKLWERMGFQGARIGKESELAPPRVRSFTTQTSAGADVAVDTRGSKSELSDPTGYTGTRSIDP